MLPAAARLGESADHRFLPAKHLDLEPVVAANAFEVAAGAVFGDDPFQTVFFGRPEKGHAVLGHMIAECQTRQLPNDLAETLFSLE